MKDYEQRERDLANMGHKDLIRFMRHAYNWLLDDASISRDSIWLLRWNDKLRKPCIEILRKRPFVIGYIGVSVQLTQFFGHFLFYFFLCCTVNA